MTILKNYEKRGEILLENTWEKFEGTFWILAFLDREKTHNPLTLSKRTLIPAYNSGIFH